MFNRQKVNDLVDGAKKKNRKITKKEIADGIGISTNSLYNLLVSNIQPSNETILGLAKYFNVDMNYFFDDVVNEELLTNDSPVPYSIKEPKDHVMSEYERNIWDVINSQRKSIDRLEVTNQKLIEEVLAVNKKKRMGLDVTSAAIS